jgi:hypothetical protein
MAASKPTRRQTNQGSIITLNQAENELLQVTQSYYYEALQARRDRIAKNRLNWDVYYGRIDWSYKQPGQSTEHLPKMSIAAEQVRAFVKKALIAFGQWYSVKVPQDYPLKQEQVVALMNRFLKKILIARNRIQPIETLIANAVMQGLMESLIVLKVHGGKQGEKVFRVEPGNPIAGIPPSLIKQGESSWRLRIDLIPTEDYFPDPTGRGLYRMHEVERDFFDVLEMAESGIYDMKVLNQIDEDYQKEPIYRRLAQQRNQNETVNPRNRRRIVLWECWGTALDSRGRPKYKDCVWTIANQKYIIRKPEPFPLWHGEDPFIEAPLMQNPHTIWSKALYDDVRDLNIAIDELYNLILDGGIASVWGVRQVHENWLVDPRQISGGVPQNATLAVTEECPIGGKVVETVTTGSVPPDAMAILNLTNQELGGAALANDLRVGSMPIKAVKATEVMASEQSANIMIDSISSELERNVIAPLLRKCWFTILQYADDIPAEDVVESIGVNAAFALSQMSPAERYVHLARADFEVMGLSATLRMGQDFQKLMALAQAAAQNPILMESYVRTVSGDKTLATMLRMLNIKPSDLELTDEEKAQIQDKIQNMQALSGLTGGKGGNPSTDGTDRSLPNEARAATSGNVESQQNFGTK